MAVLYITEIRIGQGGLSANPEKTDLVEFTRTGKLPGLFEPHIFGVTMHYSESVKYLGVILASLLTWREDVKAKVKKIHNSLWAGTRSSVATWGLNPEVVQWLYICITRPSITTFTSLVAWLSDSQCHKEAR
jgi:hypothetical protein